MMKGLHYSQRNGLMLVEKNIMETSLDLNEVLIRIIRAGICSTDLEITKGYIPEFDNILGHEFVGVAIDAGVGAKNWVGKRVCADINIQCNKCSICTDSKSASHEIQIRNHCSHRKCLGIRMMDGCFANYVRLPASNLHFVPENISDAVAVFAEPLASALRPLEQRLISERDKTAIVGDGKLGLLLGEVLVLRLRLVGLSDEEIENKVNLLGHHPKRGFIDQTQCVMSNHGDTVPYHKTEVGYRFFNNQDNSTLSKVLQEQFDVVIEASGSSSGLFLAAQLATPQGRIILKTTIATTSIKIEDLKSLEMIVVKEINLCGSRCGSIQDALSILSGKTVPDYIHNLPASTIPCEALKSLNVEKYISHVFTLSDGLTAFEEASRRGTMKVQLIIESR